MPPAIVAAGIGAAGMLGGSILGARSAGKAADTQAKAAADALAFEKEQEAKRERQWEADQRRLSPYRLAAASVLAKYGIDIPMEDAAPQIDLSGGASPESFGGPPEQPTMAPPGMSLGQLGQYGRNYGR